MTNDQWILTLKKTDFRFNALKCRDENISLQAAKFLRWIFLEGPCTNAQVINTFGMELAYVPLRAGYAANLPGQKGSEETNLWMLTPAGIDLLKRLVE